MKKVSIIKFWRKIHVKESSKNSHASCGHFLVDKYRFFIRRNGKFFNHRYRGLQIMGLYLLLENERSFPG